MSNLSAPIQFFDELSEQELLERMEHFGKRIADIDPAKHPITFMHVSETFLALYDLWDAARSEANTPEEYDPPYDRRNGDEDA